jgi:protein MpaA
MKKIQIKNLPSKKVTIWLLAGAGLLFLAYGLFSFLVPRTIAFSYAGQSCTSALTLLPDAVPQTNSTYEMKFQRGIQLGAWRPLTTSTCVTPKKAPTEGAATVAATLLPVPYLSQRYTITTPATPSLKAARSTLHPVTKPVVFQLSQADTTHTYRMTVGDKHTNCASKNTQVSCSLLALGIEQGTAYTYKLERLFKKDVLATAARGSAKTLAAVSIVDSSVPDKTVVYAKPRSITFTTNKPVTSATVNLEQEKDKKFTTIPTKTSVEGTKITLTTSQDLPRQATFRLSVAKAIGSDSSELTAPHVTAFTTSGAPKVSGINIGANGVDPSATIVVSFDQPITPAAKALARSEGVASVVNTTATTITYKLTDAARCAPIKLIIDKGVIGAENALATTEPWTFASRVNCRSTSTIGYSVQGRPIVAYYYGNGTNTVLFTGNIHGNEKSTSQTLQSFVAHMDGNAQNLPANRQVVIVPNMNPDGYAANSRNNAHNVNLDRNFPTADWQTDITSANGFLKGGGGSAPASEPETTAMIKLVRSLGPSLAISYHSQGRLVGSNSVGSADTIARAYGAAVGYGSMIGNAEETMGYTITGEFETWLGNNLGIPALVIELPAHGGNYFSAHRSVMWSAATQ